ncbi:unnamed protein product [Cunninghamella echinulata]
MRVKWTEGPTQHSQKQERSILQHEWPLLPSLPNKKTHSLSAGKHTYDFTLTLPGDLPPSLQAELGKVYYGLTATLERSGGLLIYNNIIEKKKPIYVIRSVLPSEFELIQSLEIHNTWSEKMVYDIKLPCKLYAHNAIIPVSFTILPIASKLRVHAIMATLKECCTYQANDKKKTEARIIKISRQEDPFCAAVVSNNHYDGSPPSAPWTRVLDVQVPERSPLIFCDADSDMIRIRHKLKIVISIVNPDGHFSELRASVPIVIMDSFGPTISAENAIANALPTYDESWRSLPYDPYLQETLRNQQPYNMNINNSNNNNIHQQLQQQRHVTSECRQPVTISGFTRSMSINSSMIPCQQQQNNNNTSLESIESDIEVDETVTPTNELTDEEVWWNGMDLSRVPSYRSYVENNSNNSNQLCTSLPPAYDPIWQRCFST